MGKKKILVAPLNWGLGHATRCMPIINTLIKEGFEPLIASDGATLSLLQKEFPKLKAIALPSYPVSYSKNPLFLKLRLLLKTPQFFKTLKAEQKAVSKIIKEENVKGIISDNRFGVWHNSIPTVYITHQINVLSGFTTFLTSYFHQRIIKKFDVCWVPDDVNNTLSGKLSQTNNNGIKTLYMGVLSRFKKDEKASLEVYDYLLLLSGPEPQRSLLEELLLKTFKNSSQKILMVQGKVEAKQKEFFRDDIKVINFMTQKELQKTIQQSKIVVARSGYSTIMDLSALSKKAFFIPTPGQTEQLYLAHRLSEKKIAPFALQHQFKLTDLKKLDNFKGFDKINKRNQNLAELFRIFKESKRLFLR